MTKYRSEKRVSWNSRLEILRLLKKDRTLSLADVAHLTGLNIWTVKNTYRTACEAGIVEPREATLSWEDFVPWYGNGAEATSNM